jgi:zinc transport system substrate-binding protein
VALGGALLVQAATAAEPVKVFVSIQPLAYLVERIAAADVEVHVLVPPGKNPHTYAPSPGQMLDLSSSAILFTIGVPFEKALRPRIAATMPRLRLVDVGAGVPKRRMERHTDAPAADSEAHGEDDLDPHIWLSPPLLKTQAANIAQALAAVRPERAGAFTNGLSALLADLDRTHASLQAALAPYRGRKFYVFHPAFGYFADAYGLKQEAIEMEGKSPSPKQLADLIRHAQADRVNMIVVQPEFDTRYAATVAQAIGGSTLTVNTLAPNLLDNLREIGEGIVKVLGGHGQPAKD